MSRSERSPTDAELVMSMSRGDRAALGALYDRHGSTLLALGLRMLGDRREAEDLLHDVFLEAWQRASSYLESRGSVITWLVVRMRSRCLDRLRSADRTRTVAVEDPHQLGGATVDESLGSAEKLTVRRALDDLPAEQRRVLELGYFAGLSSSEIAQAIGISIGTVKSRTAAGLSKLRAHFHEREGGEA